MPIKEFFYDRYLAGDHIAVWNEMVDLGDGIRSPEFFDDAYATARETMRRVKKNIETVIQRLEELGYQFQYPDEVHILPSSEPEKEILVIEETYGVLPLSLRAFYHEVGSVNLMQSFNQIIHFSRSKERAQSPELFILGEEDPLVVSPISWLIYDADSKNNSHYCCFAPDEFHKANYSGGENYHVTIPNPGADFVIEGMYGINERFIDYLRESFRYGGFRGKVSTIFGSATAEKISPKLSVVRFLQTALVPF